jgi:hypothetical protein
MEIEVVVNSVKQIMVCSTSILRNARRDVRHYVTTYVLHGSGRCICIQGRIGSAENMQGKSDVFTF